LEIRDDDGRVLSPFDPRPEARRRLYPRGAKTLLAALLLHVNEVVSVKDLVGYLWPDEPPSDAATTVQMRMRQLSTALQGEGRGAGALVSPRRGGYTTDVDPDAIDAVRFARLVADAAVARDGGETDLAASLAENALDLWRGSVLEDIDDLDVVTAESERMETLKAEAERLRDELTAPAVARSRTNLRPALTSFIGRHDERKQVIELLQKGRSWETAEPQARQTRQPASGRLVTLTGPGGTGKTRLAQEVAADMVDHYRDGIWLVELADLNDGPEILAEVAALVGAVDAPGIGVGAGTGPIRAESIEDRLVEQLRDRQVLLLFDNCEHVLDSVAPLAGLLLRACRDLSILATSREALGIAGEVLWLVPPLPAPEADRDLSGLLDNDAVRLFIDRAANVQPSFTLTEDNAPAVVEICRRLDGAPLAIELAAARTKALPAEEIARRLGDRFLLLGSGDRTGPAHHRTLRAAVEWSIDLLEDRERVVFERMSVFAGGCSLDAAESVCAGGEIATIDVLDLVGRLVDKSLVVAESEGGRVRYRMQETLRIFGGELRTEHEDDTARRHAAFFADLAVSQAPSLRNTAQVEALADLAREQDNFRAATSWALSEEETDLALTLTGILGWYWFLRGLGEEGIAALESALALPDGEDHLRARALMHAGWLYGQQGDVDAGTSRGEEGLRLAGEKGGDADIALAEALLVFHAGPALAIEMDRGWALLEDALARFRALDDAWGIGFVLMMYGYGERFTGGRLAEARLRGEEALESFERCGDAWGSALTLELLATCAKARGDYTQAIAHHEEGLVRIRRLGNESMAIQMQSEIGILTMLLGEDDRARQTHESAIAAARDGCCVAVYAAESYNGLGMLSRRAGDLDAAEEFHRRALDLCEKSYVGDPAWRPRTLDSLGFVAEQRGDLSRAAELHRRSLEAAAIFASPEVLALGIEGLAGVAAASRDAEHAATLLGVATAARDSAGAPLPPAERFDVDRIEATAVEQIGQEAFDIAYESGRDRNLDDTVEEILEGARPSTLSRRANHRVDESMTSPSSSTKRSRP
jgi:predicted ATPase